MIEVNHLTKSYGGKVAVDDVTFTVRPGVVTGFLGPNGAGKSTTMRAILGLDRPDSGRTSIDGQSYADLSAPLTSVGALLDARAVDKRRSARNHLRMLAATVGIGDARVDAVLDMVGLASVAHKAAGGFSLGMGQRLGIAAALLGDPDNVILDEPVNGLDPDGIRWVRDLARHLAAEGRTVLVSSHLMSEMELMADHLVVIGEGRLIADQPIEELLATAAPTHVVVASPQLHLLLDAIAGPQVEVTRLGHQARVVGLTAEAIGGQALTLGIPLTELHTATASLEEAFRELTADARGYQASLVGSTP